MASLSLLGGLLTPLVLHLLVMKINQDAQRLWTESLLPDDRLLILGASGWFGRTALFLGGLPRSSILPIGSYERKLSVGQHFFEVRAFDWNQVQAFRPTVVLDFWFLTREKIQILGSDEFEVTCRKLIERTRKIAQLESVRKVFSTSSGAAIHSAKNLEAKGSLALYGELKRAAEESLRGISEGVNAEIKIARVYSVSGSLVRRPSDYLFSSLALQALRGRIQISSPGQVFRRYAAVEDVLALGIAPGTQHYSEFSSGGQLVEAEELAMIFASNVGTDCIVNRPRRGGEIPTDFYASSGKSWERESLNAGLRTLDLRDQVKNVLGGLSRVRG